jgi:UDP-glucose 4-epimerase
MKRVLVAGGAGNLGHRLCQHLATTGYEVYALDNLSLSSDQNIKWGPLIKRDTRETGPITQALKKEKIEAIIHCAFLHDQDQSAKDPIHFYDNNLAGTLSLVKAAQAAGLNKVIFSLPPAGTVDSPYLNSLKMAEQTLKDISTATGVKIIFLDSNDPAAYQEALQALL